MTAHLTDHIQEKVSAKKAVTASWQIKNVGESEGRYGGIPHLAKNERDVGHPALVTEPEVC
jgi:hypothetical protein